VGKLTQWLRMMGFDTLFFNGENDSQMVAIALREYRILLTRDTEVMKRRVIQNGRLKAILIQSEDPEQQMRQIMNTFDLKPHLKPFTLCLECNQQLVEKTPEEVKGRVPPHVYQTQQQYMECPNCHRLFWRGTHWEAMLRKISHFTDNDTTSGGNNTKVLS
jgi:uncharacterized protein with PIN domain